MNARASLMIGALTVILFLAVGTSLFMEGRTLLGSIVLGLAALRGGAWVRQVLAAR